jgi:hypothetical protein
MYEIMNMRSNIQLIFVPNVKSTIQLKAYVLVHVPENYL